MPPLNPSSRRVSAAFAPARLAPTITYVGSVGIGRSFYPGGSGGVVPPAWPCPDCGRRRYLAISALRAEGGGNLTPTQAIMPGHRGSIGERRDLVDHDPQPPGIEVRGEIGRPQHGVQRVRG